MNKKSFRPIISILIFLAVVCLFGCENSGDPISTDPQDFTEAPAITESPAPADFQIFADEKYTCTLVLADNYPSVDYQMAKELMISLFSKTRVTINGPRRKSFTTPSKPKPSSSPPSDIASRNISS